MQNIELNEDKHLIHWCKDRSNFIEILKSKILLGNSTFIKGKHRVICFSEAPVEEIVFKGRYIPFGIAFRKETIYEKGGRPVIYEDSEEYFELPINKQWLHCRYNPLRNSRCDFRWEREWRLHLNELELNPNAMELVVPNEYWKKKLINIYLEHISNVNYMYNMCIGSGCEVFQETFPFNFQLLSQYLDIKQYGFI